MKSKVFSILQRIGRSFMLPVALLPIAGLFLGIGSSLTNPSTIATLNLEHLLGSGTLLHNFLMIFMNVGSAIFTNLPLIFAASIALGMARREKEVATLSAIIAFLVMHTAINGLLVMNGQIIGQQIAPHVLEGTITSVCGIQSLEMGVFGGIIVGLGVSWLHNRYYTIELPSILSFFEGPRFVPIISTVVFLFVGMTMFYIWPLLQQGIYFIGNLIANSGYAGTFLFGITKRLLVPFGLHHVFYLPFWQTAIGGAMEVNGSIVYGGQNIFFAQLADPSIMQFSSEATRYFTGEFIFMIFGLPGAAYAMYRCAKEEHKKIVGGLLLSAALTSILTGITEPIEFSFIFAAPLLFGVQVVLAGSAYMIAHVLNIAIGLTFSGGLLDFLVFGVLQGNAKTNWLLIIPLGILYFFLYYGSFTYLIKKFNLKTIGRDDEGDVTAFYNTKQKISKIIDPSYVIDPQAEMIVKGLGGRANFYEMDCCITRVRVSIQDMGKVQEGILKQAGAAAIVKQGQGLQIIFGPKASSIKTSVEKYLEHTLDTKHKSIINHKQEVIIIGNVVDGEVQAIEHSCDNMFAKKLIGDGIMIHPTSGIIVSPCDAIVSMIYPTCHAIGLQLEDGSEILLHVGIDTVTLNGEGFEVFVEANQRVAKGDLLLNVDLIYVKEHATSEDVMVIFTKLAKNYQIEKTYGMMKKEECMMKLRVE